MTNPADHTIASLRNHHPTLADVLATTPSPTPGSEPPSQTSLPDKTIMPKWGRMGPPIYIVGTPEAATLIQWRQTIREHSDQPLVILEPDHQHQRGAFTRHTEQWETLWTDNSIHWLTDSNWLNGAHAAFECDECFTFLQSPIVEGYASDTVTSATDTFRQDVKAHLDNQLQAYQQQANDFLSWRNNRAPLSSLTPADTHVVGFVDKNTTALIHVAHDMLNGAKDSGYRVTLHIEDHCTDSFLQFRRLQRLTQSTPDLIFSPIMPTRRSFAELADATPSIVHFSSDPQRYGLTKDAFGNQDHAVVVAPSWETLFTQFNMPSTTAPLASTMTLSDEVSDPTPWQCDAVMVGNLTGGDYGLGQQPDPIRQQIVELAKSLVISTETNAQALLEASPLTVGDAYKTALCRTIEIMAADMLRIQVVVSLAQAGLSIQIYGSDAWREALVDTPAMEAYRGPLDYTTKVPLAYAHANCVINVTSFNAHDGLPMRVFDVPRVGGVLVSNFTQGLTQCLTPGEHVLTWQTAAQAVELVKGLKSQPDRREKIARSAQQHVLENHTYAKRWKTIMESLTSRTN